MLGGFVVTPLSDSRTQNPHLLTTSHRSSLQNSVGIHYPTRERSRTRYRSTNQEYPPPPTQQESPASLASRIAVIDVDIESDTEH